MFKPRGRCPGSHKDSRGEAHPTLTDVGSVSIKYYTIGIVAVTLTLMSWLCVSRYIKYKVFIVKV